GGGRAGRHRAAGRRPAPDGRRLARDAPAARRGGRTLNLERYLAARRRTVEQALARRFPRTGAALRGAIRYSLLAGGKRLRPILALAAGEVAGASARSVLPFACALELVHTYSLV